MSEALRNDVRNWLVSKGVSLWANWLVTSDDGLEQAVDWFVRELCAFSSHRVTVRNEQLGHEYATAWDVVA